MKFHPRDSFIITQYQTACPRNVNTPIETIIQIPPSRKDDFLQDILCIATAGLNEEVLKALPKAKIRDKDIHPMTMAISTNNSNIIKIAKDKGYDTDAAKHNLQRALIYQCKEGDIKWVKTLVEYGVDVNCIEDDSDPLSAAVINKNTDIMWYLLEKGAEVHVISDNADRSITKVPAPVPKDDDSKKTPIKDKSLFNSEGLRGALSAKENKKPIPSRRAK